MTTNNQVAARTVRTLINKLEEFVANPRISDKCRYDINLYIGFMKLTPHSLNGSIGTGKKFDFWRLMKDLLEYIEIGGIDGPFYGLKSQTERVMRYF